MLAKNEIISIESTSADVVEYGKHVWISSDLNKDQQEGLIVAISSLLQVNPDKGKIEFYKISPKSIAIFRRNLN